MARNTGIRLDRVTGEVTIYHEGPVGTLPTLQDFVELSKDNTKLRSDSVKMIYDDGAGVKRLYFVTSRGNLGYTSLSATVGPAYIYFVVPEATLTVGLNKVGRIPVDFSGTITEVAATISTAPAGAAIICDVGKNGTSIWNSTPANRISILESAQTGVSTTFDTSAIVADDYLTLDVVQVGSSTAGSKLVVRVNIEKS